LLNAIERDISGNAGRESNGTSKGFTLGQGCGITTILNCCGWSTAAITTLT